MDKKDSVVSSQTQRNAVAKKNIVIAITALFYCSISNFAIIQADNIALWSSLAQNMLDHAKGALDTLPTIKEIPSWMPFESFTFGKTIFINSYVKKLLLEEQQAVVGHELSHVILNHSTRQIAAFIACALAFVYVTKKIFTKTSLSRLPPCIQKLLICAQAYTAYIMFNKYFVYPDELTAEAYNALQLGNTRAVITGLYEQMMDPIEPSWSQHIFHCIAPAVPSAKEFFEHVIVQLYSLKPHLIRHMTSKLPL